MYVHTLKDLRFAVEARFGGRARYLSTKTSDSAEGRGVVTFLFYENLQFMFVMADPPYDSLAILRKLDADVFTSDLIVKKLTFVENTESAVSEAFDVVDEYCSKILPDKFLQFFESHRGRGD